MSAAVSNKRLILVGMLWVNAPVMVLLIGGLPLTALVMHLAHPGSEDALKDGVSSQPSWSGSHSPGSGGP